MLQWTDVAIRATNIDAVECRATAFQAHQAMALSAMVPSTGLSATQIKIGVAAGIMAPPPPPGKHPRAEDPRDASGGPPAKAARRTRGGRGKKVTKPGAPAPAPAAAPVPAPAPTGAQRVCLAHLAFMLKVSPADCTKSPCPLPHITAWRNPITPAERTTLTNYCDVVKKAASLPWKNQMTAAIAALP